MCLAIPGKIISIVNDGIDDVFRTGDVSFNGNLVEVNLSMVPEAKVGDYVLVHVGTAISVIEEEEAQKTFQFIREAVDLADPDADPGENYI